MKKLQRRVLIIAFMVAFPLLPCTSDFASLPALEIPQSSIPVNFQPALGDLIRQAGSGGCDHQGYYFNNVPPPPLKVSWLCSTIELTYRNCETAG